MIPPLKTYSHIACAILICTVFSGCTKKVTMNSLIEEMTSRENLSYYPEPSYHHRQFSSYNRLSKTPGEKTWFENFDMSNFIRVENNNGRREFVMMDTEGPGAIVRWWMTFYKARNGTLRVYIDNDTTPVIEGTPFKILSGDFLSGPPLAVSVQAGAPAGEEGRDYDHNLYVPVPFAEHCKVTYECDSLTMLYNREGTPVPEGYYWPDVFYNIGIRTYSKRTRVESFSRTALEKAKPLLDSACQILVSNRVRSGVAEDFEKHIAPGDSLVLELKRKHSALNRITVNLDAKDMPQVLRSVVIQASFDGYSTLWVPVGEFFGTGYSLKSHKTWMNQRDEKGLMESFWLMPFRENCILTFINYGKDTVRIKGTAGLTSYNWKKNSMYFGSSWKEYYQVDTRDGSGYPFDLNYIDIRGKGLYAGDQVTLFNNTYEWWGEGDEKIFVDGQSFPSSFGTGSEDYYGYSFGRPEPFSHPFLSQPEGKGNTNWGITVNMRHRSLDAIPFNSLISSNIELWHWASVRMNYALTSYYYVIPPYTTNNSRNIENVRHKVALEKNDIETRGN